MSEPAMLRRRRSARPGAMVSALVVLLVVAAGLIVLVMRPAPVPAEHFVRTFSDPAGYAATVDSARPVGTAAAPASALTRRQVASTGRRILTMKGGWTSDIGAEIVRRAERWLGTPYSFAGGNYTGPTYGTPVDAASRNDGHIIGFDCSGLVMYALAPWLHLTHYAASQYVEAGQVHPSLSQLLPGDLVFWSTNGTIAGVHHVAIYIGGGNVIQAPASGELIKITPLNQVEAGAVGTTRPLTRL